MKNLRNTILLFLVLVIGGCAYSGSLIAAARNGDIEKTKHFLEQGSDINTVNHYGFTPLMVASYYGYSDLVKYLCESGADLNHVSPEGSTALIYALELNFNGIADILLDYGANPKIVNKKGHNALFYAKRRDNEKLVKRIEALMGQ